MPSIRKQLGRILLVLSLIITFAMVLDIAWLSVATYGRFWLRSHWQWGWHHSDDRSLLRPMIELWMLALVVWPFHLLGAGQERRKGLIVATSNLVGYPVVLWLFLMMNDWIVGL